VLEYPLNTIDISDKNNFSVYPNPSSNYWIIKANDNTVITAYTLSSIDGRLINNVSLYQNNSTITIQNSSLPVGQFILTIHSKNNTQNFKLIKQ
jgi:hypothetical protein